MGLFKEKLRTLQSSISSVINNLHSDAFLIQSLRRYYENDLKVGCKAHNM